MIEYLHKEAKRLRWRSKRWVAIILIMEVIIISGLFPVIGVDLRLFLALPLTVLVWLLVNNYDVLFHHHRIAIVLEVDENNLEGISRARRIVDKIESHFNSGNYGNLIRVYPLDINRFKTVKQADLYLKKPWNKFDSIILAEIDYGKQVSKETFLIRNFSIISKYLREEVKLSGVRIDLKNELSLVGRSTRFFYLEENELTERELVIESINKLLLFYSGLCLIGQERLEDALIVFKSIYNPSNTLVTFTPKSPPHQIQLTPEQVFDGRLKGLLIHIYGQLIDPIQFKGADERRLKLLTDAVITLTPAPVVYPIKVLLARTFYELGNREMAEQTTEDIYKEFGLKEEVLINRGFFAILNKNANKVLKNYQSLGKPRVDGISIVAFLHEEREKNPDCELLFAFAIAITTFIYQDKNEGKILLKEFVSKTVAIQNYRPLREHCIKLLRH